MARSDDLYAVPAALPVPQDDGACAHLPGRRWPAVSLRSTRDRRVDLSTIDANWLVVYCYPRTGVPDREALGGTAAWNAIPGARGCTPQSCAYRDHYAELQALGAEVFGLSTQDTEYQQEAAARLHLPFELLSDASLELTRALALPTFVVEGQTLLRRLTLIGRRGRIETCFYPVFPPDADADNVVRYLREHAAPGAKV